MNALKKIVIVMILGLMGTLMARPAQAQMFWIGGNTGMQIDWFGSPGYDNKVTSEGLGYNLGFFLRYGKKPFYQLEFRWNRAFNYLRDTEIPGVVLEDYVEFHKFDIPIRVGYPIVYTPMFKWHVNAGPFISTTFLFSSDEFEIERDDMRNPQFGILGGTGIQFMNFILDVDYSYHLTELFKGDEEDLNVDFKSHMQVISLRVGFMF